MINQTIGYLSVRVKEELVMDYQNIYPNYGELVVSVSQPYTDPYNPAQRKVTVVYAQIATIGYMEEKERMDLDSKIINLTSEKETLYQETIRLKEEKKKLEETLNCLSDIYKQAEETVLNYMATTVKVKSGIDE